VSVADFWPTCRATRESHGARDMVDQDLSMLRRDGIHADIPELRYWPPS
jgi:hypothetical protein